MSDAYSFTNSKGTTYYLHKKAVKLKNGREQVIYYFAKDVRPEHVRELPAGFQVLETSRTGMPVLKRV